MISEPEFVGTVEFDDPEVLTETPPPRPPRSRRPWLWALGGAVLASAVWGGGLYAYGQKKDPGPDLGGYKPVEEFCKVAELKGLAGALGKRIDAGFGPSLDEPAISESSCQITFGSAEAGPSVSVTYTLHKVTDPGPEFAARTQQHGVLQKVEGVGEQAFFDDESGQGGRLRVLDGQAEFDFQVYAQGGYEVDGKLIEPPPVDLSGIDVPMTQDALALMQALKK
ncbi:hypothetical protein ACFY8C_08295 [Streptomyces flavochromogenes]|uniref:Uncharacterized protein n=1 Tax=Streptomyces flavochromogenes TaxID=68199 RepID=A0ABW6XLH0_9ACTN|nr:hypothetical protein [Streptomyces flavochromogenes]